MWARTQPLCNPVCMVCGETVPVQPESELPTHVKFETQIRTPNNTHPPPPITRHLPPLAANLTWHRTTMGSKHSTYMRAAEVIDRVRKMKTGNRLFASNPTEDYGPGILNCHGNDRFRAKYNSGDIEDLVTSQPVSICHQRYWNEGHCGCAGRFRWCRQQWRRRQRESEVNTQRDERCT